MTLDEVYHGAQRLMDVDGRRLEIKIPAGVKTGSKVRMAGEGLPSGRGGPRGDIYLIIKVLPHPTFERRGDDLHCEVPVDLFAALLGGEVRVPTLTGPVALRIPAGTQAGRTFRLGGQGLPKLRAPPSTVTFSPKCGSCCPTSWPTASWSWCVSGPSCGVSPRARRRVWHCT